MFFRAVRVKIVLTLLVLIFLGVYSTSEYGGVFGHEAHGTLFSYPDPRAVGVMPKHIHGKAPGAVHRDRYAEISEAERQQRICADQCNQDIEGFESTTCPLCENNPKTPCGECKMCQAGFPCERTLCRHCVQPRSHNMCNSCDLTAGDEPCGTCDACREHRSDPCEHADDGHGPRGEFNPYKEPRFLSVIPRPILDTYNNGARKFPVYYNPAPYYRPHWNPSLFAGYARPFTFRWSCPLCHKDPCECSQPGFAGQVPFAYACKFCNRNPCACAQDICNVTKALDPKGISKSLADVNKNSTRIQDAEIRAKEIEKRNMQEIPEPFPNNNIPSELKDEDGRLKDEDGPLPPSQLDSPNSSTTPSPRPNIPIT
jgi:hypothetical protein